MWARGDYEPPETTGGGSSWAGAGSCAGADSCVASGVDSCAGGDSGAALGVALDSEPEGSCAGASVEDCDSVVGAGRSAGGDSLVVCPLGCGGSAGGCSEPDELLGSCAFALRLCWSLEPVVDVE
jgi:hypothetical protein